MIKFADKQFTITKNNVAIQQTILQTVQNTVIL